MSRLYFDSDYMEGCHPSILKAIKRINFEKNIGYGFDKYTLRAKRKIKQAIGNKNADVYFLVGGTQTNMCVIDSLCESYEGVLSCDTGHINVHEAGAIESTGHKVITLKNDNGKLKAKDVAKWFDDYNNDSSKSHVVKVRVVYISQSTEKGTLYTKKELEELYEVCQKNKAYLFIDGARLGYALAASEMSLKDISDNCDAFYIGGTKIGALFGEAVIFKNKKVTNNFVSKIKRHGALLAKGFVLGIQFDTLFTNNLYLEISKNAIKMANRLSESFISKGYKMAYNSPTNQIFVEFDEKTYERLQKDVSFEIWERNEEKIVGRFVTSWATTDQQIDALENLL